MRRPFRLAMVAALLGSTVAAAVPRAKPASNLRLPPGIERMIQAHATLARRAKGSADEMCALVADSYRLVNPVEVALIDVGKGLSPEDEQRLWDDVSNRVPGAFFVMSDVFTRSGVDYAKLASMTSGGDADLLRAMAELDGVWQGIANAPAWIEPITDESGCHSPARATKTLTALARSWPAASSCMRAALTKPLDEMLEQIGTNDSFCHWLDPTQRIAGARANAVQLRKLTGTQGSTRAAELIRHAISRTNARPGSPASPP